MKYFTKNRLILLLSTLTGGVVCMLLRLWMMIYGVDEKGLLVSGHGTILAYWAVTAVFLVGLVFGVKRLGHDGSYRQLFPESRLCGVMIMVSGAMIAGVGLFGGTLTDKALGLIAGGCIIYTGMARYVGARPYFVFHFAVCLFFILKLITNYQRWSADPQLQDYVFQILACILLMLASFYRASADADTIYRRKLAYTALAACFMCIVSLSDQEAPVYYGACALWAVANTGSLEPVDWGM